MSLRVLFITAFYAFWVELDAVEGFGFVFDSFYFA